MNDTTNNGCGAIGETSKENVPAVSNDTTDGKKKLVGIYGLQNKVKPEKWYVGQSNDIADRWHKAYMLLHCKGQRKIYAALKKYGTDGFQKVILEECSEQQLNDRETYWIRFYNSVERGYNLTYGGEGGHLSEETKKLLSKKHTGKTLTEEHRRKIGLKSKGRRWTVEQRKRHALRPAIVLTNEQRKSISVALKERYKDKTKHPKYGTHVSDETRERIRSATVGKKRSAEARRNIALANAGRKFSEDAKHRMSLAQQLRRQRESSLRETMTVGISSCPTESEDVQTAPFPIGPTAI